MRILIHDYSGHPFQVQLSRELARKGHDVLHVFSASFQTPHGNLTKQKEDPEGFNIKGLKLSEAFQKDSFIKRRSQEIEFGRLVAQSMNDFKPDVVISSNAPLDCQKQIQRASKALKAKFIFWVQDIYSEAIDRVVSEKIPGIGKYIGKYYKHLEYSMLRKSDGITVITDDFVDVLGQINGLDTSKISVVENWAPLDEIAQHPRDNAWAKENTNPDRLRFIYSGTLGYKHNPDLLLELARKVDADFFVFSEGRVADYVKETAAEEKLENISVRPWVPFDQLPEVLSAADGFVAMIEEEAGVFCVPSKVLTYLCVGRPILAAIPDANLARRLIDREHAGLVSSPLAPDQMIENARCLVADAKTRKQMGINARNYAETAFNISVIGDRFEKIINKAIAKNTNELGEVSCKKEHSYVAQAVSSAVTSSKD